MIFSSFSSSSSPFSDSNELRQRELSPLWTSGFTKLRLVGLLIILYTSWVELSLEWFFFNVIILEDDLLVSWQLVESSIERDKRILIDISLFLFLMKNHSFLSFKELVLIGIDVFPIFINKLILVNWK